MSQIPQSNWTNPSAFGDYKVTVTLPSIYANFYNSQFAPNDVLEKNGTTLLLDMDKLVNGMGADGLGLQTNLNVETFGFSLQMKKWRVSLDHGMRVGMYHNVPKELLQFVWGGNSQFVDETINVGPSFNMFAYQEFGLGFGYKISDQLSFGTRIKYLVGNGTYSTNRSKASIYTDPEYYQLTAETDYLINTGGLPESDVNDGEFLNMDNFEPTLFGDNTGFAFDFGATFQINDKLKLQTSIINIGKINWKDEVYNYYSNGTTTFDGLDFQPLLDEGEFSADDILDTLETTFQFSSTQSDFSTVLPSSFYLSGTYEVAKRLYVGGLIYGQAFQSDMTTAFAVNVKKDFGSIFSLGAQYSLIEGGNHNFGVSTSLRLGPVQLFAVTDNLIPVFNPMKGQNVNFRTGLNLVFGRKKSEASSLEEMPDTPALGYLKK